MARVNSYFHAFNVGVQDKRHLPRVDLERMRLAAEQQTNLLCLTTGPGFMRPGLEFISTTKDNDACRIKDFVFGVDDAALMEFSDYALRVKNEDVLITRPAVTATITSGDFSASTGWTLAATDGATSTVSGGYLNLTALARGSRASAKQVVAVVEPGVEHALRITVERGPVTLRVGSSDGGEEYVSETVLKTGTHSLAFTPSAGNFYVELFSKLPALKRVDSCTVEGAGVMTLPTIWPEADLDKMRFAQSADVVFVACDGYRPQRVERRAIRSWSVVRYQPDNGPFTVGRTRDVKLTPSVTEGNGTLTASAPFFNASHVGTLFTLFHEGFECTTPLGGAGEFTDAFRVTGIADSETPENYNDRAWVYTVSGTWTGTLRWQRSFDGADTGFRQFRYTASSSTIPITGNLGGTVNDDNDDNAIVWYKIGFEEGSYTSGAATIAVDYAGGGGSGVCRVVGYTSPTVVDIEVLSSFSGDSSTADWRECEWSGNQVWPSALTFAEGRLWWSGEDRIWGSVSDDFESFDDETEGDAGPISRSIGGGVNDTQWLLSLQRLLAGTEGAVAVVKSSSFDEPLTPTNLSIKEAATSGAASVDAVKVDSRGLYVERSGRALMELTFDGAAGEYASTQLSKLVTDLFVAGVKTVAVQRRPDTRIWVVMNDGSAVCVVYEPLEEVLAFIPIETDGQFESVTVLPDSNQDRVYFVVQRTVDGSSVRYIEKMAMDSEVAPDTLCKVMDAFTSGTNGPASATINVGAHLEGETVVVWADGAPIETSSGVRAEFVVNGSGDVVLPNAVTDWVAGLPYRVRYKSARLAYAAEGGSAMLVKKKVDQIGLVMTDFVRAGIKYGQKFDDASRPTYPLPIRKDGITAPAIVLSDVAEEEPFVFPGEWTTDSRVCLEWQSPYTATLLGMTVQITANG